MLIRNSVYNFILKVTLSYNLASDFMLIGNFKTRHQSIFIYSTKSIITAYTLYYYLIYRDL